MSFEHRLSPSRVTEAAAGKLSRALLFLLLAIYIVPGLFGREPWTPDDAAGFGVAWSMATGSTIDWWLPSIAGEAIPEEGPLPFWLGALFLRLLGPALGDFTAARLVTVFWFAIATWSLWYASYRLARRDEAQPVALAFGGEASPRDYGRMLADVSVLLLAATFGVLGRLHESGAEPVLLALVCVLLFGLAYSLDDPWAGSAVAGVTLGAVALSRGWLPAAVLAIAAVGFTAAYGARRVERAMLIALLAVLIFSIWPIGARMVDAPEAERYFEQWWQWNRASVGWPRAENLAWLLRNVGWYAWPLWPFAFWTIYSWRHFLRRPHIALPLMVVAAGLVALLLSTAPGDREFLITVPALVVLAVFGVSSLKRAAEDAIDWFSVALFSIAFSALWLYYAAWHSGFPPKMAASIERLAPGFEPQIHWGAVVAAVIATVAWIAVVIWRLRVRPPMLWKGPFLAAAGLALVGLAAYVLAAPAVDYSRSYASLAEVVSEQVRRVGGDSCVQTAAVPPSTRAMLAYHGHIRFERSSDAGLCRVLLQRDSRRASDDDAPPPGAWELVYDVTRRARFDETLRIWVRRAP